MKRRFLKNEVPGVAVNKFAAGWSSWGGHRLDPRHMNRFGK